MIHALAALALTVTAYAMPAQIKLESKLFIDEKLTASPTLVINDGQEATISDGSGSSVTELHMKPRLHPRNGEAPTVEISVEGALRRPAWQDEFTYTVETMQNTVARMERAKGIPERHRIRLEITPSLLD